MELMHELLLYCTFGKVQVSKCKCRAETAIAFAVIAKLGQATLCGKVIKTA